MTDALMDVAGKRDLEWLAGRIAQSVEAGLPAAVVIEAERSLQNIVSTAVGGLKSPEVGYARDYFENTAAGAIVVPGAATRLAPHAAALLIGLSAHLDDFDDTHLRSSVHASAAAFGAAWVAAQMEGAAADRFFTAFAHGCEVQLRVAWAMMPWHYDRGWHMTGTVGSLGAAVTAGLIQNLSAAQMSHALGFACSQSLGLREAFGTSGKPFHPGKAAANGLLAVELARAGFSACPDALFGARGFYEVLSEKTVPERVGEIFDEAWLLLENTYKPYPCGLVVHPLIDLGMAFREQGIIPEAVDRVQVHAHPIVRELTGNPEPRNPLEARFSGVHGFSLGLVFGKAGLAEFDRHGLESEEVAAVRNRVELIDDESVGWTGSRGRIDLKNGTEATAHVEAARGSLESPLSGEDLRQKFHSQVKPVLGVRTAALWSSLRSPDNGGTFAKMREAAHIMSHAEGRHDN